MRPSILRPASYATDEPSAVRLEGAQEEAESRIKRATVIQPKQYKRRFREALNRYFMASMEKYPVSMIDE